MKKTNPRPLPWFRLYHETVDDEKLGLLAFEDRWHFIAILCCKAKGILDVGKNDLIRRKLAVKMGLSQGELDEVARRLSDVGLIDKKNFQPVAWEIRQFKSDTSRERTKAYRERMKRHSDVTVTVQDTDTDTDKDKAKKQPKKSGRSQEDQKFYFKTKTACPDDFYPTDSLTALAVDKGFTGDLKELVDAMKDHHIKKGSKFVDWVAAARTWLRNHKKWHPEDFTVKPTYVNISGLEYEEPDVDIDEECFA